MPVYVQYTDTGEIFTVLRTSVPMEVGPGIAEVDDFDPAFLLGVYSSGRISYPESTAEG